MTETKQMQGQCLCGAVHLVAANASRHVGACHCKMCRRWGGGPFMEIDCGTDVAFEGEEKVSTFASSTWAERGFCSKCGTHLFYRIRETGQHMVPVGLFDETDGLEFAMQVFIDEKPGFYRFADETETMTGAEVFAKYGSSD